MEDIESDDGDVEEADYISSTSEALLVSRSVLQSCATSEEDTDEPTLRDSLLLLDEDLCELDETEIDRQNSDMESEAGEAGKICYSDDDDHSSLSSRSSGGDMSPYSPPATQGDGTSKRGRERGRGRGRGRGRSASSTDLKHTCHLNLARSPSAKTHRRGLDMGPNSVITGDLL